MGDTEHRLDRLVVVGYATRVGPGQVPALVRPIFRHKDAPGLLVAPPYAFHDDRVSGGTVIDDHELVSQEANGRFTVLDEPIPALPDHLLWVDEAQTVRYGDAAAVRAALGAVRDRCLRRAREALGRGELQRVTDLAQTAFCADHDCWHALVLKSAAAIKLGRPGAFDTYRDIARDIDPEVDFMYHVLRAVDTAGSEHALEPVAGLGFCWRDACRKRPAPPDPAFAPARAA